MVRLYVYDLQLLKLKIQHLVTYYLPSKGSNQRRQLAAKVVDSQAYVPDFTLAETICAMAARIVSFL